MMIYSLDGVTLFGIDVRYWPHPLTLPQHARKKYRRPCVKSVIRQFAAIVLWKLFHSFTTRSPTILLKSARDDHWTGKRKKNEEENHQNGIRRTRNKDRKRNDKHCTCIAFSTFLVFVHRQLLFIHSFIHSTHELCVAANDQLLSMKMENRMSELFFFFFFFLLFRILFLIQLRPYIHIHTFVLLLFWIDCPMDNGCKNDFSYFHIFFFFLPLFLSSLCVCVVPIYILRWIYVLKSMVSIVIKMGWIIQKFFFFDWIPT